jgi:putative sterol carrier protein
VAEFLSAAWLEDLHEAARTHPAVADLTLDRSLVIEQRIDDADQDGAFVYHLVFATASAAVVPGPADDPTVTFTQSAEVARAIAAGEESAQRAFMDGRLRVGGDLQALMAHHPVLTALGDVFAAVRDRTHLPAAATPDATRSDPAPGDA